MVSRLLRLTEEKLVRWTSATTPAPAEPVDVSSYAWDHVSGEVLRRFAHEIPREEKLFFMRMAIEAARRSPVRPTVGAVIVRDGEVLSTGFRDFVVVDGTTIPPRRRALHAEEAALEAAAGSLAGATLYTTLEPCFRRSMPSFAPGIEPCAVCIARSGIRTVVVGLIDPDARTRGKGTQHLAESGIRLELGHEGLEPELYALLGDGRFRHRRSHRGVRSLLKLLGRYAGPLAALRTAPAGPGARDGASEVPENRAERRD